MGLLSRLIRGKPAAAAGPDAEMLAAWVRTGYDEQLRGNPQEAERLFRAVLEHDPGCADALYFLASAAREDSRELEAVELLERAVEARPAEPAFRFVLGGCLFQLGRSAEAIASLQAGVRLAPEHQDMAANLWMAMLLDGREEEARVAVEQAREAGSDSLQIDVNLGTIYRNHARIEESLAAYQRLLRRCPHDAVNYSNFLFTLSYSDQRDARGIYDEHRKYAARFARPYVAPPPERAWPRRLRIGYVSPDFRGHVVAFFIEPVLENHDRERFEIHCYYNHRADDHHTARMRNLADHWIDCVHLTDAELADRIRADRIDILIDLAGHTAGNRLPVFAMKPAPVQMTYLGYPSTTGLAAIDYRLSDARADPAGGADAMSSERLLRLPDCFHCYRPPSAAPEVAPLPALSAGHITFGCFNNFAKISPTFLDMAARVLAAVPGSRLWLKSKPLRTPYLAERVRNAFERAGIDPGRVEMSGWKSGLAEHLAAYGKVDIALDTYPYNGTTTTCEALWMGVPVVTMAGDRHAARVGASLLHAVGYDDLVATDSDSFIGAAVALARDPVQLAAMRAGLRERVRHSPLTDEAAFTRNLERTYIEAWEARLKGDARAAHLDDQQVAQALGRARELRSMGDSAAAAEEYEKVLLARPAEPEAVSALCDLSFETGNPGAAVDWLNSAIAARPDRADLHYLLGCSLQDQGKAKDAVNCFSQCLRLDPAFAKAHNNLGWSLEMAGDIGAAMESYRRATEIDPHLSMAFHNLGNAYRQAGDLGRAIEYLREALKLESGHAAWHSNLADMLHETGELSEALVAYGAALEIDADYLLAHVGRGRVFHAMGLFEEAVKCYHRAIELTPELPLPHGLLLHALHALPGQEKQALFDAHCEWAARHANPFTWQSARAEHERCLRGRLRIGYVSGDFRRHALANFIKPVLTAHDRHRIHVFCYSNVARPDEVTREFQEMAETWRDISGLSDDEVAERLRFDAIDILVDLGGHSPGGRALLFARKPAPVQVAWLGYANTTGLRAVDYRFTDAFADPPGETERFYTERLVRLSGGFLCYQPPERSPEPGAPPSLSTNGVTFGSFNPLTGVLAMVPMWAELLRRHGPSHLLLRASGISIPQVQEEIERRFADHGVSAGQLVFQEEDEIPEQRLAAYNGIDVALDAFPYGGVTGTVEALWMGVPIVTMANEARVARGALSILRQSQLDDMVAASQADYVAKAAAWAADAEQRRTLRHSLRDRLRPSKLFDPDAFVKDLEKVYFDLWNRYATSGKELLP